MANIPRLRAVLAHIEAHPETWNQATYDCGSSHCFIGWASQMAKEEGFRRHEDSYEYVWTYGARWLGLTYEQEGTIAHPRNTLEDLRRIVDEIEADA